MHNKFARRGENGRRYAASDGHQRSSASVQGNAGGHAGSTPAAEQSILQLQFQLELQATLLCHFLADVERRQFRDRAMYAMFGR